MNVQQLIDQLLDIEDKTKKVKFFGTSAFLWANKFVEIDEIAIGKFVEIISTENDGRK